MQRNILIVIYSLGKMEIDEPTDKKCQSDGGCGKLLSKFNCSEQIRTDNKNKHGKHTEGGKKNQQLFRQANYSFRVLSRKQTETAIDLLGRQFAAQQPLTNAFASQFTAQSNYQKWQFRQQIYSFKSASKDQCFTFQSQLKSTDVDINSKLYKIFIERQIYRVEYSLFRIFINNAMDSGLTVGVFDLDDNQKLVGISLCKALQYIPPNFEQYYMRDLNFISSIVALQYEMIGKCQPEYQKIFQQKRAVVDIMAVAISREHMGKKLLHKMIKLNQSLAIKQAYRYMFCYASNFITGVALSKLKYTKIAEADSKQLVYRNVKPFYRVCQHQRMSSLWLKNLH